MDAWMHGWGFNFTLPQASDYGNQYKGKVHLWHRMKQLSNVTLPQVIDYGNQYRGKVHLWHRMKQLSNVTLPQAK